MGETKNPREKCEQSSGESSDRVIDVNDINLSNTERVSDLVEEHRKGKGVMTEDLAGMLNFQADLKEVEAYDDQVVALLQCLAQSQKEYRELQFAVSVMQEKLQQIDNKNEKSITPTVKNGDELDDIHIKGGRPQFTEQGRGGMGRRGGVRRQDWRPRIQYRPWKSKTAVVASSSYAPPKANEAGEPGKSVVEQKRIV